VSPSPTQPTAPNPLSEEDEGPIWVDVGEEFAAEVDVPDIKAAATAALAAENRQGEITLVITTDEAVAELNKQYRDMEGPTDVLSFPAQDPTPGFVTAPEMDAYLGDIIIALPFTRRQAVNLNRPLRDELRLLAVHGVLHLLGYDHADQAEETVMWARQEAILARLP
jgi:probable rRNA maturation factor